MKIRAVAILSLVTCIIAAGAVLYSYHVPVVSAVRAQELPGSGDSATMVPATPTVRKAVIASIQAQLSAFQHDDYQKAVKYQSSGLRHNFGSVAQFRSMITSSYPEFAHYKAVHFGLARTDPTANHVVIQIKLTGQDGVTLQAIYIMVREGKVYKVDGVGGGSHMPLPPIGTGSGVDA